MILIISSMQDDHAVSVMRQLEKVDARYFLFDTSEFPGRLQFSIEYAPGEKTFLLKRTDTDEAIDLKEVRVAWWRRPLPIEIHEEIIDPAAAQFTFNECHTALSGLWQILDALWINHPVYDEAASRKIYQLKMAEMAGLKIPKTLISNSPEDAKGFIKSMSGGKIIYKSFLATEQAWRETRILGSEASRNLDGVRYAPVIFQEYIEALADLRITIIGKKMFCIAVDTATLDYPFDYRVNLDAVRAEPFELPAEMKDRLLRLMDRLNLVYGAIDMRYTKAGHYYFLEINPAGQWQFLESKTSLEITQYFARFLAEVDANSGVGSAEAFDPVRQARYW